MSYIVVWLDRKEAKIFRFSDQLMERSRIESKYVDHHTHARDQLDIRREEEAFFSEIRDEITSAERILVLGPGVAKHHFFSHMIDHYPMIGRRIVGIETVDHPTDGQIADFAKKFFRLGFENEKKAR